jgi:glycosyltransferase involved in cell wall biosynthesis
MSTDNSVNIMNEYGVNVIPYDTQGKLEESAFLNIKNNSWKGSDADWVIVCDTDELIYHENIIELLTNTHANHIVTEGYEMVSETLPTTEGQIYEELKFGYSKPDYSKACLFKPSEVTNINFGPGCHFSSPTGPNIISIRDSGIKLLHYKYLNREVLIKKYAHYKVRQSQEMIRNGWGNYQEWDANVINSQFDSWLSISNNIIDSGN